MEKNSLLINSYKHIFFQDKKYYKLINKRKNGLS